MASNNWGGCLICYKESCNVIERDDIMSIDLEQIWVEVTQTYQKLMVSEKDKTCFVIM